MRTAADHMAMARKSLAFARSVLSVEYADKAGREAYPAGFQAAVAFILNRTGKAPKTHSGARSEFSRLARTDARFTRQQIAFLGWAYELKATADYGAEQPVSREEAQRAIQEAADLISVAAVAADDQPPPT